MNQRGQQAPPPSGQQKHQASGHHAGGAEGQKGDSFRATVVVQKERPQSPEAQEKVVEAHIEGKSTNCLTVGNFSLELKDSIRRGAAPDQAFQHKELKMQSGRQESARIKGYHV